jgi:hypothetical protein
MGAAVVQVPGLGPVVSVFQALLVSPFWFDFSF